VGNSTGLGSNPLRGTIGIAEDSDSKVRYAAFRQELQRLGWVDEQNVRIDVRFGEGNAARIRKQAGELVALSPDVILTTGGPAAGGPSYLLEQSIAATALLGKRRLACDPKIVRLS
jgi:ABC-type Fe3+-hydroxamate transport system substrate-binding protein